MQLADSQQVMSLIKMHQTYQKAPIVVKKWPLNGHQLGGGNDTVPTGPSWNEIRDWLLCAVRIKAIIRAA
jgi:hypothetical protein